MKVVTALVLLVLGITLRLSAEGKEVAESESGADWRRLVAQAKTALRTNSEIALQLCDRAIAVGQSNVEPRLVRAAIFDRRREYVRAIEDATQVLKLRPDSADVWQFRGTLQFKAARFSESVADFDKFLELNPDQRPHHWQRGISLYYAGKYEEGAKQFELHETVNPDDVENDVWHFLCVARGGTLDQARSRMLKPGADPRPPMDAIYDLYAGAGTPEKVLAAARAASRQSAEFYGRLYLSLYFDASGDATAAREQIAKAVVVAGDDYMGDVARVHARVLRERKP